MNEVHIPIAKPLLGEEEKRAVLSVLDSGMIAQGKKVAEFEQAFAKFVGVHHAIATSNGTTALHAALLAHGIKEGDEVITTPFSFIATANTITMCGATPVFVDIEEHSFNINPDLIEAAITTKTKAIMPVHLFGRPAEMDKIIAIAKKHNLIIIEDTCQAHGAEYNGKKAGSFGTGCFSFYATKNITTGEGGMVTTNDDAVAVKVRKIISHGSEKRYYHDHLGYNYRMTDIMAALGVEQLKKIQQFTDRRKSNAEYFDKRLNKLQNVILPEIVKGHVFHQYTLRITPQFQKTRDEVIQYLKEKGIDSSVFYPVPIHKQKAYVHHNHASFPVAEKAAQEVVSIPVHPGLSEQELQYITSVLGGLQ